MTGSSRKTKENSLPEVSENGGTVATQFAYSVWKFIFEANCANILGNLNKHGRNWIICLNNRRCDLWCMQSRHNSRKWFWLVNTYTDACHAMRRWKSAIGTLASGVSLPGASFSYPESRKSLILKLHCKLQTIGTKSTLSIKFKIRD